MEKTDRKKLWKIVPYIVCLMAFLGLTIPVKASNTGVEKIYQRVDGIDENSDLSGTYVIANVQNDENHYAAMSSREGVNWRQLLEGDNIEDNLMDCQKYIFAAGLTEWTFEKDESDNENDDLYYISTYLNGKDMYLIMSMRGENGCVLREHKESVVVSVNSDGRIRICHRNNRANWIEWYGGSSRSQNFFSEGSSQTPNDNHSFTLYERGKTYQKAKDIVKNKDLSGTYVIANVQNNTGYYAAMSSRNENYRLASDNIEGKLTADKEYIKNAELTEWTFERVEKNSYYISTKVNGEKKYLKLSQASLKNEFNIELADEKTAVNVNVNADGRISITNIDNENSRLDWYGGSTRKKTVFGGWSGAAPGDNNYFTLYGSGKTYQKVSDISQETDLSGTYVIANVENARSYYAAVSSREISTKLESDNIEKHLTDDKKYITAAELTEWTFERVDGNLYYISTNVNGETKYLRISSRNDKGEVDIVLGSEPTEVKVFVHSDRGNRISISNKDNKNCKLDWYGGEGTQNYDVFGGWNKDWLNGNNCHTLYRIGTEPDAVLYYNLNVPTESIMGIKLLNKYGGSWVEQEMISNFEDEQIISPGDSLYWLEAPEDGYFTYEKKSANQSQQIIDMLRNNGVSSGKDFIFDGWSVTVDGEEYLFDQTATVSVENHMIKITDEEKSVSVPYDTELTGKWTQISDIIAFYINENGSVLDIEGDVKRREVGQFTNALAVGRVYFTDEIVDKNYEIVGKEDTYGKDADEEICSFIDNTTEKINIVLDYVIDGEGNFNAIDEYQAKDLEKDILWYFKNKNADIAICSPFTKEEIHLNPENCDQDHYGTRWYVLKEDISDFVHIDGVLEAKTKQIKVIKTFYGLDDAAIDRLETDFNVSSELKDYQSEQYQSYAALDTNSENNGVYTYKREENSFIWTMNAIKGEVYAFKENNYKADDFYTTSVEITNQDDTKRTVMLAENESLTDINTCEVKEIHFKNYYGSGTLLIVKTDKKNPKKKLENAEFTLTPEGTSESIVRISDADGIVCFDDLQPDVTYLLKETKAPKGYKKTDKTWTVKVAFEEISSDAGVKTESLVVKIFDNSNNKDEGTVCFSENESIKYEIRNTPKLIFKDLEQPSENKTTDDKEPTGEQNPTENKGGIIPTGDSAKTMLMCGLLVCSIAALCVIAYFKRKIECR